MTSIFVPEIEQDACAHAREAFPAEACGVVVNGRYLRCPNLSPQPLRAFALPAEVMVQPGLQAIVHSHCGPWAPAHPSAHDMRQQIATGLPWGLVHATGAGASFTTWWGPGVPIPPLIGREYRHGPSGTDGKGDCYAIIKDGYKIMYNIELPEYPREDEWWDQGENLYLDNFESAGFRVIDTMPVDVTRIQPGDVVLATIGARAGIVNHGGLILPDLTMLHHLTTRLSRPDPVPRYVRFLTHLLRRN